MTANSLSTLSLSGLLPVICYMYPSPSTLPYVLYTLNMVRPFVHCLRYTQRAVMRGKHLRGLRDPNTHDIITVYHSQNTTLCVSV